MPFVASVAPWKNWLRAAQSSGCSRKRAYEEARIELRSGDVLMLFSDGVSEAHNPAEEEFGEERLKELLRKVAICR